MLTLLRILALPAVIFLILRSGDGTSTAATAVFIGAAVTDFLDGYIARKTGTVTEAGRVLDPLVDRIFISGAVVALALSGVLPVAGVLLVVARDFFAVVGYKIFESRGVLLRVSLLGKAYTAILMAAIVFSMAGIEPAGVRLGWWLFWAGVVGSIVSGTAYIARGLTLLGKARPVRE